MKAANIFHDLRNISSKDIITKTELLKLLKKYCKIISPYDLMLATARMREKENMFRPIIVKNTWKFM